MIAPSHCVSSWLIKDMACATWVGVECVFVGFIAALNIELDMHN